MSKTRFVAWQEKNVLLAGILCCMGLVVCETCFVFNICTAAPSTGDSYPDGGSYVVLSEM